jgi:hypothetical protein
VRGRSELLAATQRIEELLWDDDVLHAAVVERIRLASAHALDCPF